MTTRLKWQRGSIEGWLVAHPVPGDTRYEASLHQAEGRTHGPNWMWKVRAGIGTSRTLSGAVYDRQAASDAANEAWVQLTG